MFTGKKLTDYSFPSALNAPPASHPRRIVNGKDGTDAEISRYHRAFYAALIAAGFREAVEPAPPPAAAAQPAEPVQPDPAPAPPAVQTRPSAPAGTAEPKASLWSALLSLILSLIGART